MKVDAFGRVLILPFNLKCTKCVKCWVIFLTLFSIFTCIAKESEKTEFKDQKILSYLLVSLSSELCIPDKIDIGSDRKDILKIKFPNETLNDVYQPKLIFNELCPNVDGKLIYLFDDNSDYLSSLIIVMNNVSLKKKKQIFDGFNKHLGQQNHIAQEIQKGDLYDMYVWKHLNMILTFSNSESSDKLLIRVINNETLQLIKKMKG